MNQSIPRTEKQIKPRNYLVSFICSIVMTIVWSIPLTPVFIKLFVPFPKLENATKITGAVEVDDTPHCSKNGCAPAQFYILNDDGKHEVFCGLPTHHYDCFDSKNLIKGATGTVWFHPIFGLIQWDMKLKDTKLFEPTDIRSYEVKKDYFEHQFDFDRYSKDFYPPLVWLAASIYFGIKFNKSRKLKLLALKGNKE